MNTKQLAQYYGVSVKTAQRWCAAGRVVGVTRGPGNTYRIPEPPQLRYRLPSNSRLTMKDAYYHFLKACNRKEYAAPAELGCTAASFEAVAENLLEQGLVKKINRHGPAESTIDFIITVKGIEYMDKSKREAIDLLVKIIPILR